MLVFLPGFFSKKEGRDLHIEDAYIIKKKGVLSA